MKFERLAIPDVVLITPKMFRDERGFFSEVWTARSFAEAGLELNFVQDNHAFSKPEGTMRGLHFQLPPKAQDKLVRCTRGAILDVAVDIRRSSPTFGKHVSAVLSEENWQQLFVPKGFAHGYITLQPDTEVLYKVTEYYSPEHDRGVAWNDPAIGIEWGEVAANAVLSPKDKAQPKLADAPQLFD
ncbi:MAG: dTDP-4-dehydrorhamnose 3,5-epimerase [Hyphomicrobiaceae bacterium]|nr:dTDP-4-dehydrorhamnose 3,5-epimerase [Hyphomicrobiaceae bacterium]